MKSVKKLCGALLIFLLIGMLTCYFFIKSLKPEYIKNYVGTQLSALTNQKSSVNGTISWQIFPQPGVKVTEVQIGEEPSSYSVKLNNLLFNLKISPLLRGKLVFGELNVDGFHILIQPELTSSTKSQKPASATPADNHSKADLFAIERFLLSHGEITVIQGPRKIILSGIQIGANQVNLKQELFPLQLKSSLEISAPDETLFKTFINFSGNTSLSPSLLSAPLLGLQNTLLNGQLVLQDTQFKQLKIKKINAHVKTKSGVLSFDPLTLNLYGGKSVGDLNYGFATKKLNLNQTATNINVANLLRDVVNKPFIQGSMDFSIHAQSNLQNDFSGNGSLTIKDGAIESLDLNKIIEETTSEITRLLKEKDSNERKMLSFANFVSDLTNTSASSSSMSTAFKLFTFQYGIDTSEIQTHSIVLQSDKLQLKGGAKVNLRDYKLQSQLNVKISLANTEIDKIQQLLGGSFPLLVTGSLTTPIVLPDLKQISPLLAKTWVTETLTKFIKKHNGSSQVMDNLGELLDSKTAEPERLLKNQTIQKYLNGLKGSIHEE